MMKFYLLCVVTLWICLGQICAGSDEDVDRAKEALRGEIYGVGDQFVDDIMNLAETNLNNSYVVGYLHQAVTVLKTASQKENNSKIDANRMKDFLLEMGFDRSSAKHKAIQFEYLKIFQAILSKQLPPERYNGVVNVMFICTHDYATTEEIQSALNYLYGTDTEATKTSFLDAHNIPIPTSETDCPSEHQWYSSTIDELRRFVDIKTEVMHDFLAVREKFPCNRAVHGSLERFVHVIQQLDGDKSKINACMIKESPGNWPSNWKNDQMEDELEAWKSVLSTRLPDETFRGIINFARATIPGTPIDEIEKALEYLYEDVPKTDCPATESST